LPNELLGESPVKLMQTLSEKETDQILEMGVRKEKVITSTPTETGQ